MYKGLQVERLNISLYKSDLLFRIIYVYVVWK